MPRYALTISYDGTRFCGWQRQSNGLSVQEVLGEAVAPLCAPNPVRLEASGRTDAGVHAHGQVAHFDMERAISPGQLRRALNGELPPDIQVLHACVAPTDFHARKSVRVKEYRYTIWNAEVMPPTERLYAAHVRTPLDLTALRDAAGRFVGRHDFASFCANPHRKIANTVRTVFSCEVVIASVPAKQPSLNPIEATQRPHPRITLIVRGEGFLYKMVRSIAGFLIAVGTGKEEPSAVDELLAERQRTARVETAPACGLTLWHVEY